VAPADAAFVELPGSTALCRCIDAADRGTAARFLVGCCTVPPLAQPDTAQATAPGRVESRGRFENGPVLSALRSTLPQELRESLSGSFEWYACRGAFFHHDAHYADVLFGAWCVDGPPRDIVFARSGIRLSARPGIWVIFDPFEPHAVLDAGAVRYVREDYLGSPSNLFIGFELRLDGAVRRAFGVSAAPAGAPLLASTVAVNAETGALS
jgi:hypothetical protein